MSKRFQRRGAEAWQKIIERQRTSGRSQKVFCAAEGLVLGTFQHWKRILSTTSSTGIAIAASAQPAWFAELTPPAAEAPPPRPPIAPDWQVELDLGGGMVLRIGRGVPPC